MCLMQETIEEEMRGGSFDSPTTDHPSNHLSVIPTDLPSNCDVEIESPWSHKTVGASCCHSSSSHRTWSVACLRTVIANELSDQCATRSMPNVQWISDAATATQCICDATSARSSTTAINNRDLSGSFEDPDDRAAAAARRRCSVERCQRVTRSDPDMLKLSSSLSTSSCHQDRDASRPSSLDRSRPQRQRSLPSSCDMPLLPVNVICPTDNRWTAIMQPSYQWRNLRNCRNRTRRVVHGLGRIISVFTGLGRVYCAKRTIFYENYTKWTKIGSGTWHTDTLSA